MTLLDPTSSPACRPTESVWPKMSVPWHPWSGQSCNSLPEKLHVDDVTGHTVPMYLGGWISIFCTSYNLPLLNFTCQKGLEVRIKRQKQLANTQRKYLGLPECKQLYLPPQMGPPSEPACKFEWCHRLVTRRNFGNLPPICWVTPRGN